MKENAWINPNIRPSYVFLMFNKGICPIQVVLDTNAEPVLIADWFRVWLEMKKMMRKRKKTHAQKA